MTEYNLHEQLSSTKQIIDKAKSLNPYAYVLAFSGGDDSLTVAELLKYFNAPIDIVIFADTKTGMPQTKQFVIDYCLKNNLELHITNPKKTLRELVIKNDGFLGCGGRAHQITFGELKGKPILSKISEVLRQGKRGRKIVVWSGVRRNESKERQRAAKYATPFNEVLNDLWTLPIHIWSKEDTLEFLEWMGVERNPISVKYGRSGDCHCGTAIANPQKEFQQLLDDAPSVASEISELNQYCIDNKLTEWAEPRNKALFLEKKGQCNIFGDLDLCSGCKNRYAIELSQSRNAFSFNYG